MASALGVPMPAALPTEQVHLEEVANGTLADEPSREVDDGPDADADADEDVGDAADSAEAEADADDGDGDGDGAPEAHEAVTPSLPPKKPMSAYFLFMKDAGLRPSEAGPRWKALGPDEQTEYQRRAREAKAQYDEALEAFREAGGVEQPAASLGSAPASAPPALPLATITKHAKFDPEVGRCSREALLALQAATSLFLEHLAAETGTFVARQKRKQVRTADLAQTIRQYHLRDTHCFLEEDIVEAEPGAGAALGASGAARKRAVSRKRAAAKGDEAGEGAEGVAALTPAPKKRAGAKGQPQQVAAHERITSFFNSAPRPPAGVSAAPEGDDDDDDADEAAGGGDGMVTARMPARRHVRRVVDDDDDEEEEDEEEEEEGEAGSEAEDGEGEEEEGAGQEQSARRAADPDDEALAEDEEGVDDDGA